jgi:hypothetical protein
VDAKKVSTGPWCTNSHQSSDAAVSAHGWHEANRHIHEQSAALPPPPAVQCLALLACLSLYRPTCGADDPVSESPTAAPPPLPERHSRPAAN